MTSNPRIGVFDSGLGGLTVLREIRAAIPEAELLYLGDTARTPYGSKSVATIQHYAGECARFLAQREIDLLVVACNTVSATSLVQLEAELPFPVIGTIAPAVQAASELHKGGAVAVIGTDATISSGVYVAALREAIPGVEVVAKSCPLFVPLVEQGMFSGEIVEKVIELYLAPLRGQEVESIILGCTHYPLLRPAISAFLGDKIRIIECSTAVADRCRRELPHRPSMATPAPKFFVTDTPSRFNYFARGYFGDEALHATLVTLGVT